MIIENWLTWIIHFFLFGVYSFLFAKRSLQGIISIIVLIFATEVWEAFDWSYPQIWMWFIRFDTIADIAFGTLGMLFGMGIAILHRGEEWRQ